MEERKRYTRYCGRQKIDGAVCDVYLYVTRAPEPCLKAKAVPTNRNALLAQYGDLIRKKDRSQRDAESAGLFADRHEAELRWVSAALDELDDYIDLHTWDLTRALEEAAAWDDAFTSTSCADELTERIYEEHKDLPVRARGIVFKELLHAAERREP